MMDEDYDSPDEPCECDLPIFEDFETKLELSSWDDFDDVDRPYLLRMPQEILLQIFSYIEADFLLNVVSNVCKDLKHLLVDEKYWKIRLLNRFPKPYPIVREKNFSWTKSCKERESCARVWKSSCMPNKMITLCKSSGSTVDCVHITQDRNLCICGGRDRSMMVLKLDPEPGANNGKDPGDLFCKNLMQHNGWVWSIISQEKEFCSTSFDTTVKFWDSETLSMRQSINAQAAVLCSTYLNENTVAAGCFNKKTIILDSRMGQIVQSGIFHKGSVLNMQSTGDYIVSTGEDGLLLITDRRKMEIVQQIKSRSFAMALSSSPDQIWTGTKRGSILVYNAKNMEDVRLTAKLNYGFQGKITSLKHTTGAVYAGSTDGWLKIYQPTLKPDAIATLQLKGGVTDLSLVGKRLAVSTGEGVVVMWDQ